MAFIAAIPLLLVLINLVFGVYRRRSELLAVTVGLAGVIMLTQGAAIHGSPAGLAAITLGCAGWALGSVLSQRGFNLAPGASLSDATKAIQQYVAERDLTADVDQALDVLTPRYQHLLERLGSV